MNLQLPGAGIVREVGKVMCTLLYSEWITNKDLLYSTWNSSQCSVPAWMEEGFGDRMDTCVWMAESLCCSPETTTTLLTGYTSMQSKVYSLKKKKNLYDLKKISFNDGMLPFFFTYTCTFLISGHKTFFFFLI